MLTDTQTDRQTENTKYKMAINFPKFMDHFLNSSKSELINKNKFIYSLFSTIISSSILPPEKTYSNNSQNMRSMSLYLI